MQKKNIKSTDFTLWEIEFEISKYYNRDDYSFEDAKKDFEEKLGVEIIEEDDDEISSEIVLTTEIQYYACDSGHGGNIINDCLNALKEDSPGFSECEYEYRWIKLDYNHFLDEPYISWAIELSSYGNIKYNDGILIGDCLGLVWDDCECEACL